MKRLGSSDSLGALMSICPSTTEGHNDGNNNNDNNNVYTRDFQTMLEGFDDESGHIPEKKRRLSVEQVKALEKYFEVENKLEPERKVKLAHEVGLQPRQVAVWFQNRRARWKTKQLERDYGILKANYDSLKHNFDTLKQDNESLLKEILELKAKLQEGNSEDKVVVKEEERLIEDDQKQTVLINSSTNCDDETTELNFESFNSSNGLMGISIFTDFKDGSSDSDTSVLLNNEDNSPKAASVLQNQSPSPTRFFVSNGSSSSSTSSSMYGCGFQFTSESRAILEDAERAAYQPQFVKLEEHNFLSGDDSCTTFFTDEQPPSLHWYDPDEWN